MKEFVVIAYDGPEKYSLSWHDNEDDAMKRANFARCCAEYRHVKIMKCMAFTDSMWEPLKRFPRKRRRNNEEQHGS